MRGDSPSVAISSRIFQLKDRRPNASMACKPQLNALRLKVKVITNSGYGSVCWFGGRLLIKPEKASRGDKFAFHFRVGFPPRKRPLGVFEIDYLPIVEHDIWADLAQ